MRDGRRLMGTILSIVVLLGAGYAAVVLAAYAFQARLVFLPNVPSRQVTAAPDDVGLPYERVGIETADGLRLDGWHVPARRPRGTVLFFHGNAGNISHRLETLRILHRLRMSTLIFDYRGYGRSQGNPSEKGLYGDAEAAWRHLTGPRGVPPERVVLFGRSLGAALAAYTASRNAAAGLVLESGFVSIPEVAAEVYPWLPARRLARIRLPTAEFLARVRTPVLLIHSRSDRIIPFDQALALQRAAPGGTRLLELEGGHNDGFLVSGARYTDALDSFFAAALGE